MKPHWSNHSCSRLLLFTLGLVSLVLLNLVANLLSRNTRNTPLLQHTKQNCYPEHKDIFFSIICYDNCQNSKVYLIWCITTVAVTNIFEFQHQFYLMSIRSERLTLQYCACPAWGLNWAVVQMTAYKNQCPESQQVMNVNGPFPT